MSFACRAVVTTVLGLLWIGTTVVFGSEPRLILSAPELGCPGISGRFVAVLDTAGRALVLSPEEFPGSRGPAPVNGHALRIAPTQAREWPLAAAEVTGGGGRLWYAEYTAGVSAAGGCVAFDAARFSSEGDLASYLRWVVNELYLALPAARRPQAFRLGDRALELVVEQPGFKPMTVKGHEGATMAFRVHGIDQMVLVRAYALSADASEFAAFVVTADRPFWRAEERERAEFRLVGPDQPLRVGEATLRVRVAEGG